MPFGNIYQNFKCVYFWSSISASRNTSHRFIHMLSTLSLYLWKLETAQISSNRDRKSPCNEIYGDTWTNDIDLYEQIWKMCPDKLSKWICTLQDSMFNMTQYVLTNHTVICIGIHTGTHISICMKKLVPEPRTTQSETHKAWNHVWRLMLSSRRASM